MQHKLDALRTDLYIWTALDLEDGDGEGGAGDARGAALREFARRYHAIVEDAPPECFHLLGWDKPVKAVKS